MLSNRHIINVHEYYDDNDNQLQKAEVYEFPYAVCVCDSTC